jgi:formylglycine-generating enzyme
MKMNNSWYIQNARDHTELVLIPGGILKSDSVQHDISINSFYLSLTCVTVKQFRKFVASTNYQHDGLWDEDPEDHPIRHVHLEDARAYANWAGLRLPTGYEWEFAASGYDALKYSYPWGDSWDGTRAAWIGNKPTGGNTATVFANPRGTSVFGTFQQCGNVWEWCDDGVLRGGSWRSRDQMVFRNDRRLMGRHRSREDNNGFRLAKSVDF